MAEPFEYISHARLVYKDGYRNAYLGDVAEPVVYGVQGKLREYYGAKEGPPIASTLDHIVAAVAGWRRDAVPCWHETDRCPRARGRTPARA